MSKLQEIRKQIEECRICEEKFGFRPNPIFWGNEDAKIVQISQAPSKVVNESKKPFMDMSGKTLRQEWYQITDEEFYNQDNFYICAMAHCYPGKNKNGGDRQPPKCCFDKWIQEEIKYVKNELYVIIGSKAAGAFFSNENYEELIFKNNQLNGKLAIVLPHPSPLNNRWIKDHPEFMEKRIKEVREIVKKVIE